MDAQQGTLANSRFRLWYVIISGITIALVCLFGLYRYQLSTAVQARIADIRAAGFPANAAALDKWYAIPDGVLNAADLYVKAFTAFVEHYEMEQGVLLVSTTEFPGLGSPIDNAMRQRIERYLAANKEALDLLHKAARIEHCRYPVDLSTGLAMLLPHLAKVRQATSLLSLKAVFHAESGEGANAAEAIVDALQLGRSLDREPILISFLVRISSQGMAIKCMERVLSRIALPGTLVDTIDKALKQMDLEDSILRALAGERAMGCDVFQASPSEVKDLFGMGSLPAWLFSVYALAGLWDLDAIAYLDLWDRTLHAYKKTAS